MKDSYNNYIKRFQSWLEDLNEHELKGIQKAFFDFQKELSAIGKYSKEQIQDYSYYLKRDLEEFKQLREKQKEQDLAGAEFNEEWWLALSHLVDKTQLEWSLILDDFEHNGIYKQGEWVSFGEFQCHECGEIKHFTHPSQLDACAECNAVEFHRIASAP
jgi:hypothetical protein